jgi:RHS repeat-associated protein
VLVAEADAKSGGGDFKATSLTPAGAWTAGGSSGAFTYSYPIATPAGPSGKAPTIGLDYSSDSVDGLTSASNNQASGIGDGWTTSGGGFIERSYKSCAEDLGGNNGQTKKGDLCWFSDNATMSFAGANGPLVKDKNNGTWHTKADDGAKIEKLSGAANGAKDGEYWKVTTTDGTQYFFGLNHLPGWQGSNPETQSTWTEPVFGNNPNEPCVGTSFATSWCHQAWRWNLDYVVDPHGNATTYYYQPETNFYALNESTTAGTKYTRGGYTQRIEYGFNTHVANVYSHAPGQVLFDTAERCFPNGTITCDPNQLTKDTATSWPDVPADRICAENVKCLNASPTFFSRKRYTKISTQVTDGGTGWKTANEWALAQSFPTSGDGGSPALWLDSITQTGKADTAGNSITLPPTTFHAKTKANRVAASTQYTALTRNRIDVVTNSQGGITTVNYADPQCVPGVTMPAAPEGNTLACYPIYWTPGGLTDPIMDWFNKYPVLDITEDGRRTTPSQQAVTSQQVVTHYDYLGGGAWHYDDNPLADPRYRTWSQWRGYGTVKTRKGQTANDPAGPPTVTENRYLRGMEGVSAASYWGESVTDAKQFIGFPRETLTYLDGNVISDTLNDPWTSARTAVDTNGFEAFHTGTATSRTRVWIAATNQWRTTRKINTFGDYGLITKTEDDGLIIKNAAGVDIADPALATCTTTQYAQNTATWLLTLPGRVQKYSGTCEGANLPSPANIIADSKSSYDQQAWGVVPTAGNLTQLDTLDTWLAGGVETFVSPASKTTFDDYGRSTAVTDVSGQTTTTAYTPSTGGPVTQISTTTPPISATNPTKFTATKHLHPISGATVSEVNNSGLRTDATYDALGRLTAVWTPGLDKTQNAPASAKYAYTVSNTGANVVSSYSLLANGTYSGSFNLVDGLGRTIQTQTPTPYEQGGRVLTDSYFDSQGRAYLTHNAYWNGDSGPNGTLLVVQHNAVPNTTTTKYDSAGRSISSAFVRNGTEQWHTTTKYDGDRITTIQPQGGTASTVITNGLGQKTQLLQYKDPTNTAPGAPADATTYTYTRAGQTASIIDSTGKNTWTYSYDLQGRKSSSTDPDAGTSTSAYDALGHLASSTDARHQTLAYTYDNLGRKTAEFEGSPQGTKLAEWTFDSVKPGLPTGSIRYAGGRSYSTAVTSYDDAGRPTTTSATIPASETGLGGTYSFTTEYDALTGAARSNTSPQKGGLPFEKLNRTFGTLGNPTELSGAAPGFGNTYFVSLTKYNPLGQVLRTNFQDPTSPYQVAVTNTYDDGTSRPTTTQAQRATASNYEIANRTYTYNDAGSLTKIADTPQAAAADTQCYRYDYLLRLSDAWTPSSAKCETSPTAAALGGAAPYWTSWTFDLSGNRRTQVQHGVAGDTTTTSNYPDPGQPRPHAIQSSSTAGPGSGPAISYNYDNSGNTIQSGPGTGQTFTYDVEGHTATAKDAAGKTSTYVYDADGNRIITRDPTGTTLFVGDMELFVAAGTTTAIGTRFYSYNGQTIAERNAQKGLSWVLSDNQNTSYANVDAANLNYTKRWQDPYGVSRGPAASTWPDKRGYLGGYQNPTGLTHLGARDYDPATGIFSSVDPILNPDQPQHLNGYAYGFGNPIGNTDPTGLEPLFSECAGAGSLDCRDYYYGGSSKSLDRYNDKNMDVVRACNWNNNCVHGDNQDIIKKGSRPTRERIEAIYVRYHGEGATPEQLAQMAWEFTGIPDLADCVQNATFGGCLDAVVGLVPYLKATKGLKALSITDKATFVEKQVDKLMDSIEKSCVPHSFTSDTPVLMADGNVKNISDVHVGDELANSKPGASGLESHSVLALHITEDDRNLVDLRVASVYGNGAVTTTEHHLFWVSTTSEWVEAKYLKVGDQLDMPGSGYATVSGIATRLGDERTFDLTVEGLHAYYVLAGPSPVLVHNCGGPVSLSDDVIDTHILPRHGPGTPSRGAKFSEAVDPDDFEALANEAVSGSPIPSEVDAVTGNHAHDFNFGPGRVVGEDGQTGVRVWVSADRKVTSMYPR